MKSDSEHENRAKNWPTVDLIYWWLATGFGIGRIPIAPGTWGSLLGLLYAAGLAFLPSPWLHLVAVLATLAAVPVCGRIARRLRASDPGCVVLDEIVAFGFVFAIVPVTLLTAVIGFVLFRLFDILKPFPVSAAERLPGGWGIVADDVVAGCIAGALLAAAWYSKMLT